jgi:hypothetical protein
MYDLVARSIALLVVDYPAASTTAPRSELHIWWFCAYIIRCAVEVWTFEPVHGEHYSLWRAWSFAFAFAL